MYPLAGFVEMYTPEFLASKAPPDMPGDAARTLQPYIANLAVSAGARKQGVGSALMRACEQVCKARGELQLAPTGKYRPTGNVKERGGTGRWGGRVREERDRGQFRVHMPASTHTLNS